MSEGDPISSVIDGVVVFGNFVSPSLSEKGILWRRIDSDQPICHDRLHTEGVEWVRGHVDGEDADALLAANKLVRSAA